VVALILLIHRYFSLPQTTGQPHPSSLDSHPRPMISVYPTDWGYISTWDFLAAYIDTVLNARNPPLRLHV